ncbi:DUF7108 family protein [Salinibaculum salinum]|uniref:DUF7108 family protein n=1 Tax=Salinibaculum salinum TaxID=3131996 RepID=UPI0030EE10F1
MTETTDETDDDREVPRDVVDEAERLTRLARDATVDEEAAAYRDDRDAMVAEYDFTARVREDDRDTLVLYPEDWVEEETVRPDRIEDIDRGIERPLEGPGSADDWEVVEEHNREIAETIESEHGDPHGPNAHALADFASNHYAKPVGDMTRGELQEFLDEYFPRNAFPSDDQKVVVEKSVELVLDAADGSVDTIDSGR